MVSCHETLVEDRPSEDEQSAIGLESSKTKEEDKVVVAPIVFTLIFQYPWNATTSWGNTNCINPDT